jgi:hypothetical protein
MGSWKAGWGGFSWLAVIFDALLTQPTCAAPSGQGEIVLCSVSWCTVVASSQAVHLLWLPAGEGTPQESQQAIGLGGHLGQAKTGPV